MFFQERPTKTSLRLSLSLITEQSCSTSAHPGQTKAYSYQSYQSITDVNVSRVNVYFYLLVSHKKTEYSMLLILSDKQCYFQRRVRPIMLLENMGTDLPLSV